MAIVTPLKVQTFVERNPGLTAYKIAKQLHIYENTAKGWLTELMRQGQIKGKTLEKSPSVRITVYEPLEALKQEVWK